MLCWKKTAYWTIRYCFKHVWGHTSKQAFLDDTRKESLKLFEGSLFDHIVIEGMLILRCYMLPRHSCRIRLEIRASTNFVQMRVPHHVKNVCSITVFKLIVFLACSFSHSVNVIDVWPLCILWGPIYAHRTFTGTSEAVYISNFLFFKYRYMPLCCWCIGASNADKV